MANVPNSPGVPALATGYGVVNAVLLTADAIGLGALFGAPEWGLYLDGNPVVTADSVVSFDYREQWSISDYPLEQGAFESYNKVRVPFDVRLRFAMGGTEADRSDLLQSIAAIIGDLNQYDAVTPEQIYQSVNIVHQDYRRTAQNGANLLVIDVYCREVRVDAQADFSTNTSNAGTSGTAQTGSAATATAGSTISNPQSPSASPRVNDGVVQTSEPSTDFATRFGSWN